MHQCIVLLYCRTVRSAPAAGPKPEVSPVTSTAAISTTPPRPIPRTTQSGLLYPTLTPTCRSRARLAQCAGRGPRTTVENNPAPFGPATQRPTGPDFKYAIRRFADFPQAFPIFFEFEPCQNLYTHPQKLMIALEPSAKRCGDDGATTLLAAGNVCIISFPSTQKIAHGGHTTNSDATRRPRRLATEHAYHIGFSCRNSSGYSCLRRLLITYHMRP